MHGGEPDPFGETDALSLEPHVANIHPHQLHKVFRAVSALGIHVRVHFDGIVYYVDRERIIDTFRNESVEFFPNTTMMNKFIMVELPADNLQLKQAFFLELIKDE